MEDEGILDDHEMELFSDFLNLEEDSKVFELKASETGFSPEDIEQVFSELRMFVSARIMKRWDEERKSPEKVQINISLDIA